MKRWIKLIYEERYAFILAMAFVLFGVGIAIAVDVHENANFQCGEKR
jgi:hypothetical protein